MQALAPRPPPFADTGDGVLRIRGTRVTLDVVVAAFDAGATAEEIAQQYPTVDLGTIYLVIAHILQARPEVDAYLGRRATDAAATREHNEERFDPRGLRERLLARRPA